MSAFSSPIIGGGGTVTAPVSSTDNAVVRFDGTTGRIIQDSSVIADDSGNVTTTGTVNGAKIFAALNTYTQADFGGF